MKSTNGALVSVIIVAYNNKEWLRRSIPSLLDQSYSATEIILVDNDSQDGSGRYVLENYPQVRVIFTGNNRGFGAGCNAGARAASGKYLVFGNEDMEFSRDYVARSVEAMETDRTVGACQGTTYSINNHLSTNSYLKEDKENIVGESEVQSQGLYFNYTGMLDGEAKRMTNNGKLTEIFAATAPLCVRKTTYDIVNGFDEDFFLYFEEVDLCWRIWLIGKRIVLVPLAQAFHLGGGSTRKLLPEKLLELTTKNRMQSYIKNLGCINLVIALCVQLLIEVGALVIFIIQRKFALLLAIVRTNIWLLAHFPRLMRKRIAIQNRRKLGDEDLISRVEGRLPISKLLWLVGIGR